MKDALFFAGGLKFSGKRCSSCCRYDAGFVFLSEDDMEKLTAEVKMNRDSFIKTYCRWVSGFNDGEVLSLKEKSNNDCIFWDSSCTVYAARPLQCVTFPFWESVVSCEQSWKIAASGCPGMNSGVTHTAKEIGQYLELRAQKPAIKRAGIYSV